MPPMVSIASPFPPERFSCPVGGAREGSSPVKIAWVSCLTLPEPDPDEALGLAALRTRGHEVSVVAWDDPDLRLESFDVALLRSTWNYPEAPQAFRAFLTRAESRLWNPTEVTLWNMHKGYLLELERAGMAIVPTAVAKPGDDAAVLARARGWTDVVVKPAVGAGSMGASRFTNLERARDHGLSLEGDFLVQPTLSGFADPGERSLVWVHGAFTHTIIKGQRLAGDAEAVRLGPPPTEAEMAFARRALEAAPAPVLYARVDYVIQDGALLLSELELIEPSLFWSLGGSSLAAIDRFVDGVEALGAR